MAVIFMRFEETDEFRKAFSRLHKKYDSLSDDFYRIKKILEKEDFEIYKMTLGLHRYAGMKIPSHIYIYKITHFRCQSLKRTDKIRVVYCHLRDDDLIYFITIYSHDHRTVKKQEQFNKVLAYNFLKDSGMLT